MTEFEVSCWHEGKTRSKVIHAKHSMPYYRKHCPRTTYLMKQTDVGCHPEMLDQLARDIAFMDRTDLVESGNRSPLAGLSHHRNFEEMFNPYFYSGGERLSGAFDHTTTWRFKGDRWPVLVISEPYHFNDKEKQECDEMCDRSGYRYFAKEPSEMSMWNSNCYLIFWWHKDFYEPEWTKLIGEYCGKTTNEANDAR